MYIEMPQRPFLHIAEALMDAFGRRLAAGMDGYRDVHFLRRRPKAIVIGMRMRFVGRRERHEKCPAAAVCDRPFQLAGSFVGVAERNMRNGDETAAGILAEISHPSVIRSRV